MKAELDVEQMFIQYTALSGGNRKSTPNYLNW
jgi:hypothetical protein